MLFATFWNWLAARLAAYIGTYTAATAAAVEPVAVTLATLYIMVWGYLHLKGQIEEPVLAGAVRLLTLAVVLGVGLRLWSYHAVITETFYEAPVALAARIIGASDPVATIDTIWDRGGTVAGLLWDKGGVFNGEMGYYLAASAVYVLMGAVCVYAVFLMALSRIALAVLLALGPIFILLTLFDSTRRFFEAWLAQLANYALVSVLTVLVAALMLSIVEAYAAQTAARGAAILTVDALNMVLVAALVLLVLRQVLPIAARLAGGVALNGMGAMGSVGRVASAGARRLGWATRSTAADARQAWQNGGSLRGGALRGGGGAGSGAGGAAGGGAGRMRPSWRQSSVVGSGGGR